jgi:hypothetical protein
MAYVHLKIRRKEIGEEILKRVLSEYKDEVVAYDIEEYGREVRSEPDVILELRNVARKGGSLSLTIPNSIRKYMGIEANDMLLFVARKKIGRVYIEKVRRALLRE